MSLRSASPESFAIVDVTSGELLGSTEAARAHSTVHDGAIYMHLGRSYEVRELDLERRRALVAPFDGDWYTQPKRDTDTEIVRLLDRREALGVTLSFGEVGVTDTVLAYQRRRLADHAQIDIAALDLPPTSFSTQALWFELDAAGVARATSPSEPAGRAARDRARADRGAAADRDVRPLGHRRPVDQLPPADGRADDLHLRRPPGRHRHHAHRVRALRGAVRGRAAPDRGLPVRERLPVVRAVAEVRQPQRAAAQGRARWRCSSGLLATRRPL